MVKHTYNCIVHCIARSIVLQLCLYTTENSLIPRAVSGPAAKIRVKFKLKIVEVVLFESREAETVY